MLVYRAQDNMRVQTVNAQATLFLFCTWFKTIERFQIEKRGKQNRSSSSLIQKQPLRGVLKKRCSENMQQIYRRTLMPKCNFNKVAKQFAAYFQNNFFKEHLCVAASVY